MKFYVGYRKSRSSSIPYLNREIFENYEDLLHDSQFYEYDLDHICYLEIDNDVLLMSLMKSLDTACWRSHVLDMVEQKDKSIKHLNYYKLDFFDD